LSTLKAYFFGFFIDFFPLKAYYDIVKRNGDDATVKKFYKLDSGIKLIATNPKYDPLFYTPEEVNNLPVQVIGKVVELRAKF
jgi:repressor LexA